jgi:hypothetical protein
MKFAILSRLAFANKQFSQPDTAVPRKPSQEFGDFQRPLPAFLVPL